LFIFPPHLAGASALPGKTKKHGIASFRSDCSQWLPQCCSLATCTCV